MKNNFRTVFGLMAGITALVFLACSPDAEDMELGAKPDASFTVTPITGRVNTYLLTSTSQGAFAYKWDNGDGSGFRTGKPVDTAYFGEKGTYTIKMIALGKGGYDTTSQVVVVVADDPNGCFGLKQILTACATKTWVLKPGAGALWVGPNDPGAGAWWSNAPADVTAPDRTCLFNDTYTFNRDGSMVFDVKGDFRVDDENGQPWPNDIGHPISCQPMSAIPAKYQAWGSGNHTFRVIGTNKLQLNGLGAHLGLYKVGETGTTAVPEPTITYDVLEASPTQIVVRKQYGWGQWRFTLTPL